MSKEKIETVIMQTLKACENNGLTISEVAQLPVLLKQKLGDTIGELHKKQKFKIN